MFFFPALRTCPLSSRRLSPKRLSWKVWPFLNNGPCQMIRPLHQSQSCQWPCSMFLLARNLLSVNFWVHTDHTWSKHLIMKSTKKLADHFQSRNLRKYLLFRTLTCNKILIRWPKIVCLSILIYCILLNYWKASFIDSLLHTYLGWILKNLITIFSYYKSESAGRIIFGFLFPYLSWVCFMRYICFGYPLNERQ